MKGVNFLKRVYIVLFISAGTAIPTNAQTLTTLASFNGINGCGATYMAWMQGVDGNYYGTTGPTNGPGILPELTPAGMLTPFYSFGLTNEPLGGLILATDGNYYGTTSYGGASNYGTVFKITPQAQLTTVHNFGFSDGAYPYGTLLQAADGNFYGTTYGGGTGRCINGCGTVFKMTPQGIVTTLHSFQGAFSDGAYPIAGLTQGTDENFYGTTSSGGYYCIGGCGIVFKITPGGQETILYEFAGGGVAPSGELVQGADGNFYGTTQSGYVFKITPSGLLTSLAYVGGGLFGGLVLGTDGNFYGGTGSYDGGILFQMTPAGMTTTLYTFCTQPGCPDGGGMFGGLLQATNGLFYGTTDYGGEYRCGTAFSLDMGLGPFVAFVRNPAKVAQRFGVLGQGFTGTSSVSLNGTSAPFTVKSDTLIVATVPAAATTGFVTVTTPSGTLTSNVPFRVLPQLLSFTPMSGPVGTQVTIKGVSLTQTTGVGFGDYIPAQFTVNSDTQVTATVPTGAKTGPVGIQTQGGIAISTQAFTVTP